MIVYTSNETLPKKTVGVTEELPQNQPNVSVLKRQEIKDNRIQLSRTSLPVTKEAVARHKQLSLSQGDSPLAKRLAVQSKIVSPNQRNGLVAKQPDVQQRHCSQIQHNARSPVAMETDVSSSRSSIPVAKEPATHQKCEPLNQVRNSVSKQLVVDLSDLSSSPKEIKLSTDRARSPVAKQPDIKLKRMSLSQGNNPVSKQPVNIQRLLLSQGASRSPRQGAELSPEHHLSLSRERDVAKELCTKSTRMSLSQGNSPVAKEPVSKAKRLSLSQGNSPVAKQPVARGIRLSLNKVAKRAVPKIKRLSSTKENGQKLVQKSLLQYAFKKPMKGTFFDISNLFEFM